jgi:hypothetical protein
MATTKPVQSKAKKRPVAPPPDAPRQRWVRGSRTQVTISLAPEQLDATARRRHLNRSAMLTVLISAALEAA